MADTPLPSSHVELSPLFEESDSPISYKVNIVGSIGNVNCSNKPADRDTIISNRSLTQSNRDTILYIDKINTFVDRVSEDGAVEPIKKSKLSVSFVEPLLSSHQSADAMIQDCHKTNIDVPLSDPIDNISASSDMILPAHDDHRNTAPISSPAPARFSTHAQLHQLKSQKTVPQNPTRASVITPNSTAVAVPAAALSPPTKHTFTSNLSPVYCSQSTLYPESDISYKLESRESALVERKTNTFDFLFHRETPPSVLRCLSAKSALIPSKTLLIIRVVMLIYSTCIIVWRLTVSPKFLYYLSNWSWVFLWLYLTAAVAHNFLYYNRRLMPGCLLDRAMPYLFANSVTLIIITVSVFWALLNHKVSEQNSSVEKFSVINTHITALVVVLVDLILTRTIVYPRHVVAPIVCIVSYIVMVLLVNWSFELPFPYPFFSEVVHYGTVMPILAVILSTAAFFMIPFFLCRTRDWLFKDMVANARINSVATI
ncbi:hypothetical protein BATDEDRAFT_90600 [Batrachochytrium dendrobatidis JAM81]|uniref:Uncharacterized protein n=2 Tax=Batrachochytrium dendrobatidis TaxID=109871 RepID=F4P7M8_BATDJ|nr:uncharacterized protein BATDEDRAFT_90600 [Batrachochytrium dendrobatidis JAM81]EGF78633.1 hypothetical protein BATDEDRAFT_90600 [Batrachochytrium dendrobatidis JAM81]KAK5664960.1 hypothetical protein QVD99_008498 [Batrachochytrium dendrobatidis]OAJ43460.1 hypothetical protein BDEG_26819 [Batrachochytrium dendrobatidis JEL423]|eukprot:XP_006680919.1 hypothetical protein BATDEDRAFT_90600 [Batrachochytrium dendrobatidis JAM81]